MRSLHVCISVPFYIQNELQTYFNDMRACLHACMMGVCMAMHASAQLRENAGFSFAGV